jgi:hypothetical protein
MKRITYLSLILIVACGQPKQKGLIYYNDCESIKGWAPVYLSKKYAHSGMFSNKLDSAHQYGFTFKQTFKDISDERVSRIKISMWTFITPDAKGKMVIEIRNHDGHTVFWQSTQLDAPTIKRNIWQQVSAEYTVHADSVNRPENTVAIYPWCNAKSDFYIDDIRIEFVLGYN